MRLVYDATKGVVCKDCLPEDVEKRDNGTKL